MLLCTQFFWAQIPTPITRISAILTRLDLVHIGSYPVSVLAMLTVQRCFQRRVASSFPT